MISVINAGFYTSIQDSGRIGYQHYGVPISGVMDKRAAELANALVGNNEDAAVLELTMSGPKLEFNSNTAIAITGANMSPVLNGNPIESNHFTVVKSGDILSFGKLSSGFRSYLAILGGFQTDKVLGSRSMYRGITKSQIIKKGDILKCNHKNTNSLKHFAGLRIEDSYLKVSSLEVYAGPEFNLLNGIQKKQLLEKAFSISKENNRMAYQLEEILDNNLEPILTSPVLPGTVQLTPSGKLIVLMRDCQTTGGYPRVLQLSETAIHSLAQKLTGNTINFKLKT